MSLENDVYIAPLDMAGRNPTVVDEISRHPTRDPLIQSYSFDLNNQTHIINGISVLEPISNLHGDVPFLNRASIADSSSLVTLHGHDIMGDTSNPIDSTEFQERLAGGTSIPSASLAAILGARIGLLENLENSAALSPSLGSLGSLAPYIFNWQDTSNPLPATFGDPVVNKFQPCSSLGNLDPDGWTSSNVANLNHHAYSTCNYSNELSLSLATSPSSGQCSEVSCSDVTHCMNGTRSGLEHTSCSSRHNFQFSPEVLGSRYLVGIQDILAQIARYAFENLEQINWSAASNKACGNKSTLAFSPKRRMVINHNENSMLEAHAESLQRHAAESMKTQLLTLLQLVDDRYGQCLDEIHTVVSAFHAATESDPHIHAHFALQTISLLYKDLRERISNHILAMGSNFNNSCSEEKEWSVETSFIQKQWTLQQLKRKDQQLWRPQRGLPERSVSVLRAWMFQNFLHPYPKDAEKHLLAVKSGLTRSQVSNWFINARVRLWKPMIEEMYAEMNRRKACRNEEGTESSHRGRISMNNHLRFNTN